MFSNLFKIRISLFAKIYSRNFKLIILLLIKNKSLSISEPKRNAVVLNKLRAISDNFFNYIEMLEGFRSDKLFDYGISGTSVNPDPWTLADMTGFIAEK